MSDTQILSGPASTKRLLANLSLAIDEAMLVRKIVSISDQIRSIENLSDQSGRFQFLREEILYMEGQLSSVRKRAIRN